MFKFKEIREKQESLKCGGDETPLWHVSPRVEDGNTCPRIEKLDRRGGCSLFRYEIRVSQGLEDYGPNWLSSLSLVVFLGFSCNFSGLGPYPLILKKYWRKKKREKQESLKEKREKRGLDFCESILDRMCKFNLYNEEKIVTKLNFNAW